jgi:uncharacterized protein YwqG
MVVFISLATHLLMAAKVGGVPFLLSIFQRTINEGDRPMLTLKKIPLKPINRLLQTLEITLFGSLILGLILPVL